MRKLAFVLVALLTFVVPALAQPVIDFTADATSVSAGDVVTFTGTATGGTALAWQWNLGDGTQVATAGPVLEHVYDVSGVFTVSLNVVSLPQGAPVVKVDYIDVASAELVPSFSATPASGEVVLGVQFVDTTSGVGAPTAWAWSFGDGGTSTAQSPFHSYQAPGSYTVSLEVFASGESWALVVPDAVVVDPAPLVPDFTVAPVSGVLPLEVSFADATTGAVPTSYAWTFGDGGSSTGAAPVHVYDTPGSYTVSMTAFVGQQGETITKTDVITVDPAPLVPSFTASVTSGPVPLAVFFDDTSTGATPTSYLWDLGDGATSLAQSPQHLYEVPGDYTVSLEVSYFGQTETVVIEDLIHVDHLATLHVPGDAPTIQAAIDMATPFTEILVAPGIWHEALVLGSNAVTIRGTGGAGQTIIDASGTEQPVVRVPNNAPLGTTLAGLTLTGGRSVNGGGVRVGSGAKLTVRECIVRDNESLGEGGAVWVADTGAVVRVVDSVLRDNVAASNGGGLAIGDAFPFDTSTSVVLERCAVVGNVAGGYGGGLLSGTAIDCVLSGNHAGVSGGGAAGTTSQGCTFAANSAVDVGGGLFDFDNSFTFFASVTVDDCIFRDNTAGVSGGGASLSASATLLANVLVSRCVFAGNSAPIGDGLAGSGTPGTTRVIQSTFFGDSVLGADDLEIRDSIFRGHPTPFETSIIDSVEYSDIEGGWPGDGNIDADPLFVAAAAGAFGLRPGSPCIDAADPAGTANDIGALPFASIYDVGVALYGSRGLPSLQVSGALAAGAEISVAFERGPPSGSVTLVIGAAALSAPFKGGTLVPLPLDLVPGLPLDTTGALTLPGTWPAGLPTGTTVWLQGWFVDAAGPRGFSSTAGTALVQP